jgi:DNA invertase Pin-like site-specific DNA recombinase
LQNHNISRAQAAEMLNEAQRASVAAKLANIKAGGDRRSDQTANLQFDSVSRAQAAEMLNVSERSVTTAKKVHESAIPEIIEKVDTRKSELKLSLKNMMGMILWVMLSVGT